MNPLFLVHKNHSMVQRLAARYLLKQERIELVVLLYIRSIVNPWDALNALYDRCVSEFPDRGNAHLEDQEWTSIIASPRE